MPQVYWRLGVPEQTYCRWRREYGSVRADQVKQVKEREKENARLRTVVADLNLDDGILKEAASPNF